MGTRLLLFAALSFVIPENCFAAQQYKVEPAPAWVIPQALVFTEGKSVPVDSSAELFYLVDSQINVDSEESYTHNAFKILNETGLQNNSQLSFSFDPSYQTLSIHQISIWRGTNVMDRLDEKKIKLIQQEKELDRHIYNGTLSAILFLDDTRVGDIVEYAYSIRGRNPILQSKFVGSFIAQWRVPIVQQYYRLIHSDSRVLNIRNHGLQKTPEVRTRDGLKEYIWRWEDHPALAVEDSLPVWYDIYPWIQISEFASWTNVTEWALELYPVPSILSEELMEKVDMWKKEPSIESRVLNALQFLQDEVRYLGIEFGPNSHQPSDPSLVFSRRFGDCKDKAYLLQTVLRHLDVDSTPALVHSSYRHAIVDWLPSPYAFDHVVLQIVLNGETNWVDPTRSFQRGNLKQRYFPNYRKTLLVKKGTTELTSIPPFQSGYPKMQVTDTFRFLGTNGPVELNVQTVAEGLQAERLRWSFASTSRPEIERDYLNHYARHHPEISATRNLEFVDFAQSNRIEITEFYLISNLWSVTSGGSVEECFFYPQALRDVLERPKTTLRKMPWGAAHPTDYEYRMIILLADKWEIENENVTITNKAFAYSSSVKQTGNKVEVSYRYRTLSDFVEASDLAGYIKDLDKILAELGYQFTRPIKASMTSGSSMNWSIFLGGMLFTVLLIFLSVRACQYQPASPPFIGEYAPELKGIGGWLILVAIGLFLRPVLLITQFFTTISSYSAETWNAVTTPGAEAYHSWWAPTLLFELLANLTLLVYSGLLIVLFFKKRRTFPAFFMAFLIGYVCVLVIDQLLAAQISTIDQTTLGSETRDIVRAGVQAFIWCSYFAISKRVKATFVN